MEEDFNLKFESLYKIIVLALKVNRCHPDVKRDWKWIVYIVLAHGFFFFVYCIVLYSTVFYDIKNKNFTQACANGVLAVIFNVVTLKYIVMVVYQKTLAEIIVKINKDYETAKSFSKQERDIILKYARKGKTIVKWWTYFALATAFLFMSKSVVLMTYYSLAGEFKLVHAYDMNYPKFVEDKKGELHVYLILYSFFIYYDLYAAIMYIGFVPLVPIFVLHACGQIEIVTTRLLNLSDSSHPKHIVQRQIKGIIIYVQEIQSFVKKIRYSMIFFYELLLKAAVILIPVTGYQILKSSQNGDFRIEFISVFIGSVTESGMPCFLGDVLLESSESMRQAVYACGWETHPHAGTRGLIKTLLVQTSRPVALNTLFRVISRDALTDVYHHAYAIFNLMNAMWN
ncbi:uncharacterized protein LOC121727113 [Aricia agestis]|uniref:uncharacterized protein LOC121727113 n=1 Tax=Aricia agestis TaxID=91739 RepID=UPI001C20453F|nr:uncharacterized protein LOC121727113 [Aricia agestis]